MSWIPFPVLTWHPLSQPPTEARFYHLRYRSGQIAVRFFRDGLWYVDRPCAQFTQVANVADFDAWREMLEQPI